MAQNIRLIYFRLLELNFETRRTTEYDEATYPTNQGVLSNSQCKRRHFMAEGSGHTSKTRSKLVDWNIRIPNVYADHTHDKLACDRVNASSHGWHNARMSLATSKPRF